ncbi:MAG: hypothetical protein K2N52_04875 [Clostridia bacterium]|nr:hypothetical protein [Clostridia bacterium]
MKKSKSIYVKIIVLIFVFALTLTVLAVPVRVASANSAQKNWSGITSSGTMVTDENCPIEVESEILTFDIRQFPDFYFYEQSEFDGYGAKVTAHYNFYNPADYDVDMTLVFPFGNFPSYVDSELSDDGKYSVTADGEAVESTLRHTFDYGNFNAERDVAKISDSFKEDGVFSPDAPVHGYCYRISGLTVREAYINLKTYYDRANTAVFYSITDGGGEGALYCSQGSSLGTVKNGYYVYLFVVGEEIVPQFTFTAEGFFYDKVTDGYAELQRDDEMTFKELVLAYRDENSDVSEVDWYNAMLDYIEEFGYLAEYVNYRLMRWCEYRLTIPAGGRLVNEVTVPLYPDINGYYSPSVYGYEYLLSPARCWAAFGSLEIVINTPYFVLGNSLGEFEKTEDGYVLSLNGLPDRELNFRLCAEENPTREDSWMKLGGVIGIIVCIIFFGVPVLIHIIALVVALIALAATGQFRCKPKDKNCNNLQK